MPIGLALSARPLPREEVVAGGLFFGAIYYGSLLHWVPFTIQGMIPLGALLGLLSIALLAATAGAQAWALHHLVARSGRPVSLVLPAVWVSTEWSLAHVGSLAIPWTPLGLSLAAVPTLAGLAEWVGVGGLSLWIGLVNGGLVQGLITPSSRRARVAAALTLALWVGPATLGVVRLRSLSTEDLPPVAVAQIQVVRGDLLDPEVRDLRVEEALARVLSESEGIGSASPTGPAVVILPEAPFREIWGPRLAERVESITRELGGPVLIGAHVVADGSPGEDGSDSLYNAVMMLRQGEAPRLVHRKRRLVPGVERPGLSGGPPGEVLPLDGLSVGLAICFEVAFGRDVRRLRAEGADLLVNPTNDAWFRPHLPLVGSAALGQHRAHLILRALETRMGAVRSSMGGELLIVDPDGRLSSLRPAGDEGLILTRPSTSRATTLYVRCGDIGAFLGLGLLAGLLLSLLQIRGRTRSLA